MAHERDARTPSRLVEIGRRFYARGWVLGTSGNFSAVVSRAPLRLAMTASALPKGSLRPSDILLCDEKAQVVAERRRRVRRQPASKKPSAEALLHIEIARRRSAGA